MMAIQSHMKDMPAMGQRPPEAESSEEEEYEEADESQPLSPFPLSRGE